MFFSGGRPRKGKDQRVQITLDFSEAVSGLEAEIPIGNRKVKVKIPAGVHTGSEVRFAGKGDEGPVVSGKQLPSGDLYVHIHINERSLPDFDIVGSDISTVIELPYPDLVLGTTVEVSVVDPNSKGGVGLAKLKIPDGTQSGQQFRMSGKGMPKPSGRGRGDAYVRVLVKVPKRVSGKEKELLKQLSDIQAQ